MTKPTEQELTTAIEQAKHLRETGQDEHFVGKALLNCNYQMGYLLEVFHAAEHYLHSGMSETEHTRLLKAIEKARQVGEYSVHYKEPDITI